MTSKNCTMESTLQTVFETFQIMKQVANATVFDENHNILQQNNCAATNTYVGNFDQEHLYQVVANTDAVFDQNPATVLSEPRLVFQERQGQLERRLSD